MRKLTRTIAIVAALGVAGPVWAQSDAKDTATEKKSDAKRAVRHHKPGGETASDKVEDAKDATRSATAKAKKKARKAGRHVKKQGQRAKGETTGSESTTPSH